MSEPITTNIILAEFIPEPARTPQLARQIDAAISAGNEAALIQIIQATHQVLAQQQNQIDQIANFQQTQSNELSQIRQEIRQLSQTPQQPQVVYNISDNRNFNYTQTTSYENCWNTYDDHSDNSSDTCNNTSGGSWWLIIPAFLIFAIWMCPNAPQSQQNSPPRLERAR